MGFKNINIPIPEQTCFNTLKIPLNPLETTLNQCQFDNVWLNWETHLNSIKPPKKRLEFINNPIETTLNSPKHLETTLHARACVIMIILKKISYDNMRTPLPARPLISIITP